MNLSRIKCPYCGEEIAATAKKCRFCNEWLPASGTAGQTQQPVTPQAAPQRQAYQQTAYQQTGYVQSQQQPAYQQAAYQQPPYQQSAYQQAPMQQPMYQAPATTDVVDDEEEEDDDYTPSFFEAYFKWSFFSEYKDFNDVIGRKSFWLSMLSLLIINLGITGVALLIIALSNMASWALTAAGILIAVWSLVMIVPSIAIGCRRLRDAEKSPWLYLLCLIPLVGPVILLVLWCQASKYEDSDYYAEFKQVDIIITAVSIILFVAGMIAMNNGLSGIFDGISDYETEYYTDTDNDSDVEAYTWEENTDATDVVPETTTHSFSGIIDGKYKIRMTLRSDGHGEYYYTKNGPDATLTLIITELDDNGKIKIEEYNDNGEQTGLFEGRMDNSGDIKGWFTNYKGKQMPFYLEQINGD